LLAGAANAAEGGKPVKVDPKLLEAEEMARGLAPPSLAKRGDPFAATGKPEMVPADYREALKCLEGTGPRQRLPRPASSAPWWCDTPTAPPARGVRFGLPRRKMGGLSRRKTSSVPGVILHRT
jgi:hypothetical protein